MATATLEIPPEAVTKLELTLTLIINYLKQKDHNFTTKNLMLLKSVKEKTYHRLIDLKTSTLH